MASLSVEKGLNLSWKLQGVPPLSGKTQRAQTAEIRDEIQRSRAALSAEATNHTHRKHRSQVNTRDRGNQEQLLSHRGPGFLDTAHSGSHKHTKHVPPEELSSPYNQRPAEGSSPALGVSLSPQQPQCPGPQRHQQETPWGATPAPGHIQQHLCDNPGVHQPWHVIARGGISHCTASPSQ